MGTTPVKPPTAEEATIFSKALRGDKLTKKEEETLGGRGLSEVAATARAHAAASKAADEAEKKKEVAKAKVEKAVTKAKAKPRP